MKKYIIPETEKVAFVAERFIATSIIDKSDNKLGNENEILTNKYGWDSADWSE